MRWVEPLHLRHVLAGVDSAILQLLCHAVAVVCVLHLCPADVEAHYGLLGVAELHVSELTAEACGLMVAAQVVDKAGFALATFAVSDPDDVSVVGWFSQLLKDGSLPRAGLKALFCRWPGLKGISQVLYAPRELDVCSWKLRGDLPDGGTIPDQLTDSVEIAAVSLRDAAVAKLCRSEVAGLLLTAVGDVLLSGATRRLHVSSREESHAGLEAREAHGLKQLAVALDVQLACGRALFCLPDGVAHWGPGEVVRPVEDPLDGNHSVTKLVVCEAISGDV